MKIITADNVKLAVDGLREGKVIVFPTETSYGLGCDATNPEAVGRIFLIKQRDRGNPLPVLVPDMETAKAYVQFGKKARVLAKKFWPGALNIVVPREINSRIVPACSKDGFQAVRVSSDAFAQEMVRIFGGPVVATSANISGNSPAYSAVRLENVFKKREQQPDIIIDAGELQPNPPSTTVRVDDGGADVLRKGAVDIPRELL